MASLVATYNYDLKRVVPTPGGTTGVSMAKAVLWNFVHQLTGDLNGFTQGVWTCEGSGNGVGSGGSGGMDGVNRWWNGGTYSEALIATGAGANVNTWGAWMVLRAPSNFPGGNRPSLLLTFTALPYGIPGIDVRTYVTNGVFTGGDVNDIPTTISPMITAETIHYNWILSLTSDTDTTLRNCHLSLATDGGFFWWCNRQGDARAFNAMAFIPLLEADPLDQAPWAFWRSGPHTYNDATPTLSGSQYSFSRSSFSLGKFIVGQPIGQRCDAIFAIGFNGGSVVNAAISYPVTHLYTDPNNWATLPRAVGLDSARQKYHESALWLEDASPCMRGRLRDLWLCSGGIAEGTVEPSGAGPITRIVLGDMLVPCNSIITF